MEIKIGKKQYFWAYLAYFFKVGNFFFIMPFVGKFLPKAHVDVWFLFTAITMGIGLLDFGFTPNVSRAITNAFSGAREIPREGVSETIAGGSPNYVLLLSLFRASKRIYAIIAILALLLLSSGGTFYLWNMCENLNLSFADVASVWNVLESSSVAGVLCPWQTYPNSEILLFHEIVPTWALFVLSTVLAIYFKYLEVFMGGRGAIALANKIGLASGCLGIVLTIAVLYLGFGLLGTVCVSLILSLLARLVIVRLYFDEELKRNLKTAEKVLEKPDVLPAIWHNAKKSGLNSIGVFLIYHATAFIGGYYFPLSEFTKIVITMRVFNFLNAFSSSYFNLSYPRYVSLLINKKLENLRWEFLRALFISLVILLLGFAMVVWRGDELLNLVGHGKIRLPETAVLLLYAAVFLSEAIHGKCATLITVKNVIPFVPTTFLTGMVTIGLSVFFILAFELGIIAFPLATLCAQLAYNSWRWPLWVIRDFGFSPRDLRNTVVFSCRSARHNFNRLIARWS